PDLPQVRPQGGGVEHQLGRPGLAVDADLHKQGAAADVPADDLLQLGFEHRVRVGAADGDLEVAVVHRPDLDGHAQAVGLVPGLAEPRHAEQHAVGPLGGRAGHSPRGIAGVVSWAWVSYLTTFTWIMMNR